MRKILGWGILGALLLYLAAPYLSPYIKLPPSLKLALQYDNAVGTSAFYLMARQAEKLDDPREAGVFYEQLLDEHKSVSSELAQSALRAHLLAGDVPAAIRAAKAVVVAAPAHQQANFLLAISAIADDDYALAQTRLAKMPQTPMTKFLRPHVALWLAVATQDDEARAGALNALQGDVAFPQISLVQAARAAELAGDGDAAAALYNRGAIANGNDYLFFTLDYGAFLERRDNMLNAEVNYLHYHRRYQGGHQGGYEAHPHITAALARVQNLGLPPEMPPPPRPALSRAPLAHMVKGIQALSEVLQDDGHGALALSYAHIGDYLATQTNMENADTAFLRYQIGQHAMRLAQWQTAYHRFGGIGRGDILYDEAQIKRAEMLDRMGETETAIAQLYTLLDDTNVPAVMVRITATLGELYRRHERFTEAEVAYSRAIDGLPPKPQTLIMQWHLYFARGVARERLGDWALAESDLQKARHLSKGAPHVLNYLGYSWVNRGVYIHEGLKILNKAVRAAPDNGFFIDSLGWAYYKLRRYHNALTLLERASRLQPNDPTITDHLGDVLWQLGRRLEARYQWNKALSFNPSADERARLKEKRTQGVSPPPRAKPPMRLPRGGVAI